MSKFKLQVGQRIDVFKINKFDSIYASDYTAGTYRACVERHTSSLRNIISNCMVAWPLITDNRFGAPIEAQLIGCCKITKLKENK